MPVINVVISEVDHQQLEQEHADLVNAWPRLGHQSLPPPFATWLGMRLAPQSGELQEATALGDIRVFNAIERLVTSLPQHGFQLVHTVADGADPALAAQSLAQVMVAAFKLQQTYVKRLQELFFHYVKGARETADAALVGITNRAYGALTEAHRKLTERTIDGIDKLGPERAIGRVEGATAILVSVNVMDRLSARKRTSAFKAQVQAVKKSGWVGKIFGAP